MWAYPISYGESEAASAEEGSHDVLMLGNLRVEDRKQHNTHRERERERHREYNSIIKRYATVTNEQQQQPLQKVTKSLYIVTHLGQLPFILFT